MSNFDSIQTNKIGFLDIGNSTIKLGFRRESQWEIQSFSDAEALIQVLTKNEIEYLMVCNVRASIDLIEQLAQFFSIAVLETSDIPKEQLQYATPETLGMDRFLACYGAWSLYQEDVIVIDAGSACTIDFMDSNGVYHGGVIMPGIQTLLGVFHKSAPALPRFDFNIPEVFPGNSSKSSLDWGLSQLFLDGVNANLARFSEKLATYKIVITGGDAELVRDQLKMETELRPDLIFIGMESFLEE